MKEADIIHETTHLHAVRVPAGVEIRLNQSTHSVAVGVKQTLDAAKVTMERLERYPANLRHLTR